MAELKTKKTAASVSDFIAGLPDPAARTDCATLVKLMRAATGQPPKMWGTAIVGFGTYHYVYASGREGDWFQMGFAPRKGSLSLYLMPGVERFAPLLKALGPHKHGKGCLYIKSLDAVDGAVLKKLLAAVAAGFKQPAPRKRAP